MNVPTGYALLIAATMLTAAGQICFKITARKESSIWRNLLHPTFLLGGALFTAAPVLTSLAARTIDYSILYGMSSLSMLFVLPLAHWLLDERIDWPKWAGVCTIMIGLTIMVSGG